MALPFKAVAVDVDGTFVNDDKKYDHEWFERILDRLDQENIHFIIASGRPYERLRGDFRDFADRIDFVANNGAMIVNHGEACIIKEFPRPVVLNLIYQISLKYPKAKRSIVVSGVKHSYILKEMPPAMKEIIYYFYPRTLELDDFTQLPDDTYIKLTLSFKNSIRQQLENEFNATTSYQIHATTSGWEDIDITRQGVNKAAALAQLLQQFDAGLPDLIAFGDGNNDLEMLRAAGISYAMENGQEIVKQTAKFIAPSNNDNGVFKTLEAYLDGKKDA